MLLTTSSTERYPFHKRQLRSNIVFVLRPLFKSGPKFSGENGPGGPLFLEFWSSGPKFFVTVHQRRTEYVIYALAKDWQRITWCVSNSGALIYTYGMPNVTKSVVLVSACDIEGILHNVWHAEWKPGTSRILKKIKFRPRIMIATFDLAAEQISKRSVVQLLRYGLKCTPHTRNYFRVNAIFDIVT